MNIGELTFVNETRLSKREVTYSMVVMGPAPDIVIHVIRGKLIAKGLRAFIDLNTAEVIKAVRLGKYPSKRELFSFSLLYETSEYPAFDWNVKKWNRPISLI